MANFDDLQSELQQRKANDLYRSRLVVDSAPGREVVINGRSLLNFSSNDYLGLANDDRVKQAFAAGVARWGAGSGSSHLICGHTAAHHELEAALADFTGRPRCLLFASGYAANVGTINALVGKGDDVFEDRLNHASLLDGGLISGARFRRYAHRDPLDLAHKLARAGTGEQGNGKRTLVVTDGTFSMDGSICDIPATAAVARKHGAWLMVDEAHSLGVTGNQGRGLIDAAIFGTDDVQVLIGTLGKAFGTQGGFVAGSEALIETLIQQARTYIYSTALPAAVAAATLVSLNIVRDEEWRRERVRDLIGRFRTGAEQLGLQIMDSQTAIQPVILGGERDALQMSTELAERGLLISAIRPPTVPSGTSRLRVTLTAAHDKSDVDRLVEALDDVRKTA